MLEESQLDYEHGLSNEDQNAKFEHSLQGNDPVNDSVAERVSQMSKLRESKLDQQVDYNVEKILKILCKVLISEVTTEIAQQKPPVYVQGGNPSESATIQSGEQVLTMADIKDSTRKSDEGLPVEMFLQSS